MSIVGFQSSLDSLDASIRAWQDSFEGLDWWKNQWDREYKDLDGLLSDYAGMPERQQKNMASEIKALSSDREALVQKITSLSMLESSCISLVEELRSAERELRRLARRDKVSEDFFVPYNKVMEAILVHVDAIKNSADRLDMLKELDFKAVSDAISALENAASRLRASRS